MVPWWSHHHVRCHCSYDAIEGLGPYQSLVASDTSELLKLGAEGERRRDRLAGASKHKSVHTRLSRIGYDTTCFRQVARLVRTDSPRR